MQDERVCVGSGFGRKFSSCSGSAAASEASGAVHVGAAGTVPADFIVAVHSEARVAAVLFSALFSAALPRRALQAAQPNLVLRLQSHLAVQEKK